MAKFLLPFRLYQQYLDIARAQNPRFDYQTRAKRTEVIRQIHAIEQAKRTHTLPDIL